MARRCKQCGSENIEDDSARGDATCVDCGTVLEESVVVNENQFAERAGGSGHTLVGQFVSMEKQAALAGGLGAQESREQTYARGRKLIEEVASQLRISQHCIDTAFNFFKMCVSRGHTRGRIRSHVVAALLYMTCRIENTPHLLLDFSDVTQVNVFELGRTLNFLTRTLHINLPTTDPCLYVLRFAVMLDFGDKQKEVVSLATRLVQRMKRDWLATGRRPTGLCGAALLLAARFYNFNRTVSDVVGVVHISEAVVRKRLDEFARTPSSQLTLDDFATVDLEQSEDPPAFVEAQRKRKIAEAEKKRKDEESVAGAIEAELEPVGEELEAALEKKRREKFKRGWGKLVGGDLDDADVRQAEEVVRDEILDIVYDAASPQKTRSEPSTSTSLLGPSLESLGILRPSTSSSGAERSPLKTPTKAQESPSRKRKKKLADGELDLEDIDDAEIETYILTEKEVELKERFWMRANGEHMLELERRRKERQEQAEREEQEALEPGALKRKKRNQKKKSAGTGGNSAGAGNGNPPQNQGMPSGSAGALAATATEVMGKMIAERRLSKKIDYDVLRQIELATADENLEIPSTSAPPAAVDISPSVPSAVLPSKPSATAAVVVVPDQLEPETVAMPPPPPPSSSSIPLRRPGAAGRSSLGRLAALATASEPKIEAKLEAKQETAGGGEETTPKQQPSRLVRRPMMKVRPLMGTAK